MATIRQVDLLIRLLSKHGHLRDACARRNNIERPEDVGTRLLNEFTEETRAWASGLSSKEASEAIRKVNAACGWDAATSPSTDAQRMFIADLERKAFGRRQTTPMLPLTYAEADAKIRNLRDFLAVRSAPKTAASPHSARHLKLVN